MIPPANGRCTSRQRHRVRVVPPRLDCPARSRNRRLIHMVASACSPVCWPRLTRDDSQQTYPRRSVCSCFSIISSEHGKRARTFHQQRTTHHVATQNGDPLCSALTRAEPALKDPWLRGGYSQRSSESSFAKHLKNMRYLKTVAGTAGWIRTTDLLIHSQAL